ncbi:MAG TPA: NAD(P)H-binding protein [Pedobacter sp.]|jgi:nucleoside-diphosphate-sugar epimerase|nr:NAD(P)H-binding protein [Pedobacter sp.]
MKIETISILGCGWYGLGLAKVLVAKGYTLKGSTTSEDKLTLLKAANIIPYLINFENDFASYEEDFFNCDVLIICIPPKRDAQADYPNKINKIALAAKKAQVKQVIFISSTGIFQNGNFIVDEKIIPEPTTNAGQALLAAEETLKQDLHFTTTIIRFAGLIGPNRNLAKHFAGKVAIANGLAPINLIHLVDCIGITTEIIAQKAFGNIYHGVTPDHPSRKDFYSKACLASGLEKPAFTNELLDWKQIESINVSEVLAYEYVYDTWNKYFNELTQ